MTTTRVDTRIEFKRAIGKAVVGDHIESCGTFYSLTHRGWLLAQGSTFIASDVDKDEALRYWDIYDKPEKETTLEQDLTAMEVGESLEHLETVYWRVPGGWVFTQETTLASYDGKVAHIVNVASCFVPEPMVTRVHTEAVGDVSITDTWNERQQDEPEILTRFKLKMQYRLGAGDDHSLGKTQVLFEQSSGFRDVRVEETTLYGAWVLNVVFEIDAPGAEEAEEEAESIILTFYPNATQTLCEEIT